MYYYSNVAGDKVLCLSSFLVVVGGVCVSLSQVIKFNV